jgi:predicted amidohydrolase
MDARVVTVVTRSIEAAIFDGDALLERACELIVDASQAGASWIIFPEAYLPGGPAWLLYGLDDAACPHELRAAALANAIAIPGDVSDRLCRVAQRSRVAVAMGLVERDDGTCYNSLLIIDAQGRICGHYRAAPGAGRLRRWSPVADTITAHTGQAHSQQDWAGGI